MPTIGGNFDNYSSGIIIHELCHPCSTGDHYDDADGDGNDDQPNDFKTIMYNYFEAPQEYEGQDIKGDPLQFGQGDADGFLRYINLQGDGSIDVTHPLP